MSVVEQQLDELRPRVARNEEALSNLVRRFDELVPKLTIAVDNLTMAVERWTMQRTIVTKMAVWVIGVLAAVGTSVIAAKLIGLL